jgi:glycosyl transferase family 87/WD40 repeat protein
MHLLSKGLFSTATIHLVAVGTFVFLLVGAFRSGWTHAETDFPNYYTAAVLVRQHQPLHNYYDWTWFARQMNYAGNGMQIGGYTPQTPLTMLPMIGIAGFAPQEAKRIWLVCNLLFLGITVWLLSRVTTFGFEVIWLLAFCGYFSLRTNFLYGQYYVFLLFMLTLTFYFLQCQKDWLGGVVVGFAFVLKLYGGPFLLYFVIKRQWRALFGMMAVVLLLGGVALALFGQADLRYYATQILPRSLEVGQVDPYNPGDATFSTLLMRSFVAEPELNPHPLWQAPWLFFFLRSFTSLATVAFLLLGVSMKRTTDRHNFAWFVVTAFLLSTSTSSYSFIVLLLPLVLLLQESGPLRCFLLTATYVLLTLPLRPAFLFPKVGLLFALFIAIGWPCWRAIPRRTALYAMVAVALIAFLSAEQRMKNYQSEPGQHFERVAVQGGALFSSFPVVSKFGVFYQSMSRAHYVLRWLHDSQNQEIAFDGQALHPRLAPDGNSVDFELVLNRTSSMMKFDPFTGRSTPITIGIPADTAVSVVSPDGRWMAFESTRDGPTHIFLRDLTSGQERRLTGGNCNSSSPAWELDSKAILFASDCERAFGLPALYRARLTEN